MTTENRKMTEVKTAMLLHVPFFASLLLDMMEIKVGKFVNIWPPGKETAATDGKTIYVDEDFLSSMPLPEAVFVICHEVGHAMWQHMGRGKKYHDAGFEGKPFNARAWNYAGDYVINDMLVKSKIGKMPGMGLLNPQYNSEMLVDDVYREVMKNPPSDDGGFDTHILAPDKANAAEWKRAAKSAANAAKAMGKLPENLERFVDKLLNPKVPWQEKLRHLVTKSAARDSTTWAKPNKRRLINQGVVMPSYTGFQAGHVIVAVDTSGSIAEKELTAFMSELQNILDTAKPIRCTVLAIDADIHDVTELMDGDSLLDNMPPLKGGGGTSFIPAFEWVVKEDAQPATMVYFTDMYGAFPQEAPDYPVIWCSTTKNPKAPFGEVLEIDVNSYDRDDDDEDEDEDDDE
jgi:predicted metal-dependent peptidase